MATYTDFGIDLGDRAGVEVKTTCPQCSASRKKSHYPCCNVNTEKGVWHCWHCGWSGSLERGVEQRAYDGQQRPPRVYTKPSYDPQILGLRTTQWFARRGITESVLKRRMISVGRVYMPQEEEEVDAIQFPYFRAGEVVNIKYRDAKKNFRMVAGAERILYGLDDIQPAALWFTEGEIDALSLEVAGYRSVVSVPDGAPAPSTKNYGTKFTFLADLDTRITPATKIVLAVDTDAPGQTLATELARRFGPERCWSVQWLPGCKDANEVLVHHGVEALRGCLEQAFPWPISGDIRINSLASAINDLYEHGRDTAVSTGWTTLDPYYAVRPGHLTVITGSPQYGKSAWVSALMIRMALTHGWRFMVFSPENYPPAEYATMLLEQYLGQSFFDMGYGRMSKPDLWEAQAWLDEHVFMVDAADEKPTVDWLLTLAKVHVLRDGIRGLIIDPWNEIEHARPYRQTETDYIGETLMKLRRFGRLHGVHIFVVAHPTKLQRAQKGKYEGQYAPATLYDVSSSAHWYNKPDMGISIWRDVMSGTSEVEVHILKVRRKYDGKPGVVTLTYDRRTGRYYDPGTEPMPAYNSHASYERTT